MKRIAVIAAALLIAAICPGRASAADHWYSFTEIENTNITGLYNNYRQHGIRSEYRRLGKAVRYRYFGVRGNDRAPGSL